MKKCPFCAEDIQDAAIFCKHCHRDVPSLPPPQTPATIPGIVLDEGIEQHAEVAEPALVTPLPVGRRKLTQNERWFVGVCICVCGFLALAIWNEVSPAPRTAPDTTNFVRPVTSTSTPSTTWSPSAPASKSSPEYQLAALDCKCPPPDDDTTMLRFRFLLNDLSKTTGLSNAELAEFTARAQKLAKGYGKDISLLDLMETGRSLVALAGGKPDYPRALSAVVAQRVR